MRIAVLITNDHKPSTFYSSFIRHATQTAFQQFCNKVNVFTSFKQLRSHQHEQDFIVVEETAATKGAFNLIEQTRLSSLVKKNKVEIIVNLMGRLTSIDKAKQILVLPCTSLSETKEKRINALLKKIQQQQQGIGSLIVCSQELQQHLINEWQIDESLITVISPFTTNAAEEISFDEREALKCTYADGEEYFLVKGITSEKRFIDLLKEFSKFKKWQQSRMKLVVMLNDEKLFEVCNKKLESYRYKIAVKLTREKAQQYALLLQGCYAVILDIEQINVFEEALHAFKNRAAVLLPTKIAELNFLKEACLLYSDTEPLCDKLIALYKDEALRSNMISTGITNYERHLMPDAVEKLWQVINTKAAAR